jgi:DNA modification methylase
MAANASRNHPGPRGRYRTRSAGACQPRPTPSSSNGEPIAANFGHLGERNLAVEWRDPQVLVPYARNPRTHTKKQIQQIAASIGTFGFTNPILIDDAGGIIAGHGRVEAAKLLGLAAVPTIRLSHLNETQKRAYVLADNRLGELAGWDQSLLAIELQHLTEIDLDFEVEVTGFETVDIDLILSGAAHSEASAENELPVVDPDEIVVPVTRVGDLWQLGRHRLLCADALRADSYQRLLQGEKAQMVFADPPYNVPVNGHVCGSGRIKHEEFVMASGEMSEAQFTEFLTAVFSQLARFSTDGSIHFHCMDWRHIQELMTAGRAVYTQLKNLCVWAKTNAGMGSFFRSQHELIFVFKNGTAPHINNFGLGEGGRYRTNLWSYPGVNTFRSGRLDELGMHPTVKPLALVADAIKDCSKRGGIILDAFSGSGTTIVAAEQTGRHGYALELDPKYVDVAVRRWEKVTGENAVHADTGLTLDRLAESRGIALDGASRGEPNRAGTEVGHG